MMNMRTRLYPQLALVLAAIGASMAGETPTNVLGSPEFRATPEHPFGWRGDGSGRFPGATPPTIWSLTKNVRWSAVVGRSYSSPVVSDKFVFVCAEPNFLICLDRATGKEQWKLTTTPADIGDAALRAKADAYKSKDTGLTAATPLIDGTSIYVVFANGIVRAVDYNGKPKWTIFIDAEQSTAYGRSASPIITGGKLIVHMTNLYAFDPATGKQLWVNDEAKTTYGTPAGFKHDGGDLIVTPAGDVVRTEDGKGVNNGLGPAFHTTPVIYNETLFFGDREIRAVKLGAKFKDEEQWNNEVTGDVFGSPLLHDGLFFTVSALGQLYAFDAKGKGSETPVIDARSLFGEAGGGPLAYASLTLAGKYLFINSLRGDIAVLEATPEAKLVATNKMKEGSGASLVFSGKDMFVRDGETLYCIGE